MVSNIDEGFEQPTDRAFANYVYISKASTAETRTRLRLAWRRGYITNEELQERLSAANDVGRLATGLIAHLIRSNRKNRGIVRRLGNEERPDRTTRR